MATIQETTIEIRQIEVDREWGQFHMVSNLVLALVGKVDVLAAGIQWVKDVLIFTFRESHWTQVFRK